MAFFKILAKSDIFQKKKNPAILLAYSLTNLFTSATNIFLVYFVMFSNVVYLKVYYVIFFYLFSNRWW